ncbi:MAG: diacylglycerol kinase [Patescibacteria group bacterium]
MIKFRNLNSSIRHAFKGAVLVFRSEHSFRIQIFIALMVLLLSILLKINIFELVLILLLIGVVLVLEIINSVFERIVDTFKPRIHPVVRDMKDMMAAAVLISAVISGCIGILIFAPKLKIVFMTLF